MINGREWLKNDYYNSSDVEIDGIIDQVYQSREEEDSLYIVCPNCGEKLYNDNIHYPSLGLCEYCLPDYKERIEL